MIYSARHAIGKPVRGQALVAHDGFSARYDLDRARGVFSRATHKLAGQSYAGRILVLDTAKGGVASAWMLHEMAGVRSGRIIPALQNVAHLRDHPNPTLTDLPVRVLLGTLGRQVPDTAGIVKDLERLLGGAPGGQALDFSKPA